MSKKLNETLRKRREELGKKGGSYPYFIFKDEGQYRMRPLPVGDDHDFAYEVTFFYLGALKGYISPATFGEPCAIMKLYNKLSKSDKDSDKDFAKSFRPKKKFMIPHIIYKDLAGKEVDESVGAKLLLLTDGLYKDLLDLYLDPEQGDFTDPATGYDIKYKRTGKGMTDTEYSCVPCKPTKINKKFAKPVDPEAMVRAITPSYEESKEIRAKFLNQDDSAAPSSDAGEAPVRKKKKKKKVTAE